jgi:uncharacterized protein (TIGR03032 family)
VKKENNSDKNLSEEIPGVETVSAEDALKEAAIKEVEQESAVQKSGAQLANNGARVRISGDDTSEKVVNPFQLHIKGELTHWLVQRGVALLFSTYQAGKVIMIGPNKGKLTVSERNFGRAMGLVPVEDGLLLGTEYAVWRFRNGLKPGYQYEGWDKIFLPQDSHVTGSVDTHDIDVDKDGNVVAAITGYNCLAILDKTGNFSPIWKPPFISKIIGEDRCHLNGFCMEEGEVAYASVVAKSNTAGGWRDHRVDGGMIYDVRTNEIVCSGLSMPHSPRLHRGKLWLLEAGTGYFGYVDLEAKEFIRVAWCPGFVRGLRFIGGFALVGLSKPRHKTFQGLPLDQKLEEQQCEAECGIYIINISTGKIEHKLNITGSVEELYDVMVVEDTQCPLLVGLEGKEVRRFIKIGEDHCQ